MELSNRVALCTLILCLCSTAHGQAQQQQKQDGAASPPEGVDDLTMYVPGELLIFPPAAELESVESCIPQGLDCADDEVCSPVDEGEGVCATLPVGGVAFPASVSSFPTPIAYYPLTGGSLEPWPQNGFSGVSHEIVWKKDSRFGLVPHCEEDSLSMIALQGVPFGHDGPFSVNLWIQKDKGTNLEGGAFQYIFSVTSLANSRLARSRWEFANQIHVFVPETLSSAPPLVRVIVQDSDDGGKIYYMDSDGAVERVSVPNGINSTHTDLDDGKWHMITVTTISEEKKGFRIYVDGELTAETPDNGESHGGLPIFADGDIFLCGRTDHNPERHFDGSVTQLSIYDVRLTEEQVQDLYHAVASSGLIASDTLSFARNEDKEQDRIDNYEESPQKVSFSGVGDINEFRHDDYAATSTLCTEAQGCEEGQICGALHLSSIDKLNIEGEAAEDNTGLCAKPPTGGLPDQQTLTSTPVPFAFFPLTGGDTRSWPVPKYSGLPLRLELHDDEVFGSVFRCAQRNLSMLVMDEVPFGESGAFALNIWFRPTNLTGPLFQYLISQTDERNSEGTFWGEQLSVYLGETLHVAFGLVRTIFKDEADTLDEIYVDSDGLISLTQPVERTPSIEIKDGNWHMYTFTTNAPGEKGYKIYLDGVMVGNVDEDSISDSPEVIPGGDPFTPVGALLLCGRKDGHPERHFEGDIAHLSLFDSNLSEEAIEGLFKSISKNKLDISRDMNIAPEYPEFPLTYFGFPTNFAPEVEPESVQAIDEAPGDPHKTAHPAGPPPFVMPRPIDEPDLAPAPAPALSSTTGVLETPVSPPQTLPPRTPGPQPSSFQGIQPLTPGSTQSSAQQPATTPPGTGVPEAQFVPAPLESLPESQEDDPSSTADLPTTAAPQTLLPETPPPEPMPNQTPQLVGAPESRSEQGSSGATEPEEPVEAAPAPVSRGANYVSDLD